MTKLLLGCAVLALSVGCAAAPVQKKTAVKVVEMNEANTTSPDKTYICEEGHKPGSNIKAPVCQTVRDRELERVATQDTLHRMMQSGYRR